MCSCCYATWFPGFSTLNSSNTMKTGCLERGLYLPHGFDRLQLVASIFQARELVYRAHVESFAELSMENVHQTLFSTLTYNNLGATLSCYMKGQLHFTKLHLWCRFIGSTTSLSCTIVWTVFQRERMRAWHSLGLMNQKIVSKYRNLGGWSHLCVFIWEYVRDRGHDCG